MSFVIGGPCVDVKDNACTQECPVDCIYEGERMEYIHPGECIDCGACEAVCPVEAIRPGQRLDPEWLPFRESAKQVFLQIRSPGGSSRIPQPLVDTAFVTSYEKAD